MAAKMKQSNHRWKTVFLLKALVFSAVVVAVCVDATAPVSAQSQESVESKVRLQNRATPVRLMSLRIENQIVVQRRFLGRVEARQSADIAFAFSGTIDSIPVREGERVRKGEVLASVNTDSLVLQRESLAASLSAAQSQLDTATADAERLRRLVSRGAAAASRLEDAVSQTDTLASRLIEVQSTVEQTELQLRKSRLIAPFDGIVGARGANLGETVAPGQSIVSIYEGGRADFRVGLPTTLRPDSLMNTRIRVSGQEYEVRLRAIRPDIDFRTNTRIAIFEVLTQDLVSFGLSATLIGEVSEPLRGAWVPVDAMRPSAQGYWIVLAVDEDMIARRVAVEVQHLRGDQAYVIGAFDSGTRIISGGAHKVVPGQTVRAK